MRRWVILPVPLLLFLLFPSPAAPEHESCVGVTSRFFRQGLNFFVRGRYGTGAPMRFGTCA